MLTRIIPHLIAALALAPALLLPAGAGAATAVHLDLEALVDSSSFIFHGEVESVETLNLGTQPAPRIVTDVTLRVRRVLKGATPGETFTLRLVGGTWGGRTVAIPGQPTFSAGEELVLFLEWTGTAYTLCGLAQGKFRITRDAEGRAWASRDLADLLLVRPEDQVGDASGTPSADARVPLDDLFRSIRNAKE